MTESLTVVKQVIAPLLSGSRRATKYISPSLVIKATRRHRPDDRARFVEMVLTVGAPNWQEREFIKAAKKAGEPFPIKRVQLKEYPPIA